MKNFWLCITIGAVLIGFNFQFAKSADDYGTGKSVEGEKNVKKKAKGDEKKGVAVKKKKKFSRNYGLAGCGLGSVIVGKKGGQIFAWTSNYYTSFNQVFAITIGTSNCEDDPNSEVASRMDHFIVANKGALASDIAKGQGETLNHLSSLMGCSNVSQDFEREFAQIMQGNFRQIFPDTKVAPNEITDAIVSTIQDHKTLSESCKNIS